MAFSRRHEKFSDRHSPAAHHNLVHRGCVRVRAACYGMLLDFPENAFKVSVFALLAIILYLTVMSASVVTES